MLVQGTRTHAFHDAWFANAGVHLYLVFRPGNCRSADDI